MSFRHYHAEQLLTTGLPVERMRSSWHLRLYGFAVLLIFSLLVIADRASIPFGVFTQDPLALTKGEAYFGLLSNVGILFWCASATVCLFVSSLIPALPGRRFLTMSGLLTLLLLLDDLFLLHEDVLPRLLAIRQRYVLLIYLLVATLYLISYWKVILHSYPVIMVVALGLFGLSLAEDALALAPERWHYLLEDGAKLFGIISWFNYFFLVCREEVQRCRVSNP